MTKDTTVFNIGRIDSEGVPIEFTQIVRHGLAPVPLVGQRYNVQAEANEDQETFIVDEVQWNLWADGSLDLWISLLPSKPAE